MRDGLRRVHHLFLHRHAIGHRARQALVMVGDQVEGLEQRFKLDFVQARSVQSLDIGLHVVRHFAQAHGAGQTRAAFESVQTTQHQREMHRIGGFGDPLAQRTANLWQQFDRLFFEHSEHFGIDVISQVTDRGSRWRLRCHRLAEHLHRLGLGRSFRLGLRQGIAWRLAIQRFLQASDDLRIGLPQESRSKLVQ